VAEYTRPGEPRGCPLVLTAVQCSVDGQAVGDFLHERRLETHRMILARIKRGVRDGDLPRRADVAAMAMFVATFVHGLSVQARDGASRAALLAAVDCAMRAWDAFAA